MGSKQVLLKLSDEAFGAAKAAAAAADLGLQDWLRSLISEATGGSGVDIQGVLDAGGEISDGPSDIQISGSADIREDLRYPTKAERAAMLDANSPYISMRGVEDLIVMGSCSLHPEARQVKGALRCRECSAPLVPFEPEKVG